METLDHRSYFFDAGIRFGCTQCGKCCTGEPGKVWLTKVEAANISAFLRITPAAFRKRYCRPGSGRFLLREKSNGDCIFFSGGCSIYTVRPKQCRTFPFWTENLRSEEAWKHTCEDCPGIGQGRLYTKEEILQATAGRFEL